MKGELILEIITQSALDVSAPASNGAAKRMFWEIHFCIGGNVCFATSVLDMRYVQGTLRNNFHIDCCERYL